MCWDRYTPLISVIVLHALTCWVAASIAENRGKRIIIYVEPANDDVQVAEEFHDAVGLAFGIASLGNEVLLSSSLSDAEQLLPKANNSTPGTVSYFSNEQILWTLQNTTQPIDLLVIACTKLRYSTCTFRELAALTNNVVFWAQARFHTPSDERKLKQLLVHGIHGKLRAIVSPTYFMRDYILRVLGPDIGLLRPLMTVIYSEVSSYAQNGTKDPHSYIYISTTRQDLRGAQTALDILLKLHAHNITAKLTILHYDGLIRNLQIEHLSGEESFRIITYTTTEELLSLASEVAATVWLCFRESGGCSLRLARQLLAIGVTPLVGSADLEIIEMLRDWTPLAIERSVIEIPVEGMHSPQFIDLVVESIIRTHRNSESANIIRTWNDAAAEWLKVAFKEQIPVTVRMNALSLIGIKFTLQQTEVAPKPSKPAIGVVVVYNAVNIQQSEANQQLIEAVAKCGHVHSVVEVLTNGTDDLLEAYDYGMHHITNVDYVLCMDGGLRGYNDEWLSKLIDGITDDAGIIGSTVLSNKGIILNSGIAISELGDQSRSLIAYQRFEGMPASYRLANTTSVVRGVDPRIFLVRRALWQRFDETFRSKAVFSLNNTATLMMLYFSLMAAAVDNLRTVIARDSVVIASSSATGVNEYGGLVSSRNLLASWQHLLLPQLKTSYSLPADVSVLLWANVNSPSCGSMMNEAVRWALALEGRIRMQFAQLQPYSCDMGLPFAMQQSIERLRLTKLDTHYISLMFPLWRNNQLSWFLEDNQQLGKILVSRMPWETTRLLLKRLAAMKAVDDVWPTVLFLEQVATAAGISRSKVKALPNPIDGHYYDPALHHPLSSLGEPRRKNSTQPFSFLSVSNWDIRKNPTLLINAFLEEFRAPNDSVRLVIKTSKALNVRQLALLELFEPERTRLHPPIVFLKHFIREYEVPSLYSSADCFVLTSYGEGWGLPLQEAVTMKIPVIALNWTGHLDFLTAEYAYLVEVDHMANANWGAYAGQWAVGSKEHLRKLMREVYENYMNAQERARIGRKQMLEYFNNSAVGSKIVEQIGKLARKRNRELFQNDG